jgi:hypothetical protein
MAAVASGPARLVPAAHVPVARVALVPVARSVPAAAHVPVAPGVPVAGISMVDAPVVVAVAGMARTVAAPAMALAHPTRARLRSPLSRAARWRFRRSSWSKT